MAAALQCEICGGKLIGKPGGIFECDSCGTEYSTEWARAKIQEIKGTVKVEGTVEVKGTVKLDGPVKVEGGVNAESLLKRGWMALEDGKWLEAQVAFDQVLNLEPENVRAHLGRYLGVNKIHTMTEAEEQYEEYFYVASREGETCPVCRDGKLTEKEEGLFRCPACGNLFDSRKKIAETSRIRQLADAELKQWFARMDSRIEEVRRQREEKAKRKAEEARIQRKEKKAHLSAVRERLKNVQGRSLSVSENCIVGLQPDGTAVIAESYKQIDVSGWLDMTAVAAGNNHAVGLKPDGTVAAAGDNKFGRCAVTGWSDIVAVAAGRFHTVGLRKDGTVVATSYTGDAENYFGQCDVDGWSDIVAIATSDHHTVGLKKNGTVVATNITRSGGNHGQHNVYGWRDIVSIAAGMNTTVGLKADGTVVAVGNNTAGQCDVGSWTDIVAIAAGRSHTVGLKSDGTVVATKYTGYSKLYNGQCDVDSWTQIVAIAAAERDTVGLRADGTVVSAGCQYFGEKKTAKWKLFGSIDTLEQEREEGRLQARRKAEEERRIAEEKRQARIASLNSEKATLSTELAGLKGLFSGRRRREIEGRLAEIETELKSLS